MKYVVFQVSEKWYQKRFKLSSNINILTISLKSFSWILKITILKWCPRKKTYVWLFKLSLRGLLSLLDFMRFILNWAAIEENTSTISVTLKLINDTCVLLALFLLRESHVIHSNSVNSLVRKLLIETWLIKRFNSIPNRWPSGRVSARAFFSHSFYASELLDFLGTVGSKLAPKLPHVISNDRESQNCYIALILSITRFWRHHFDTNFEQNTVKWNGVEIEVLYFDNWFERWLKT